MASNFSVMRETELFAERKGGGVGKLKRAEFRGGKEKGTAGPTCTVRQDPSLDTKNANDWIDEWACHSVAVALKWISDKLSKV